MNIEYYSHLCACGCGGKIEVKKWYKYNGIPLYINGHQTRGENNPFYGKNHLEGSKNKISESKKGKQGYWKGKNHPEVTKQKISKSNKGKKSWNKGLTKEVDGRLRKAAKKSSISHKGLNLGEANYFYGKNL